MSQKLYEEALADVRALRSVAEEDAKRAVFEALTPRIRDLIEQQLMGEASPADQTEEQLLGLAGEVLDTTPVDPISNPKPPEGPSVVGPAGLSVARAGAVVSPAPDGTAVIDIDAALGQGTGQVPTPGALQPGQVQQPPTDVRLPPPLIASQDGTDTDDSDVEYVLDMESVSRLSPLIGGRTAIEVSGKIRRLEARVEAASRLARSPVCENSVNSRRILGLLSEVENMYDHVQSSGMTQEQKGVQGDRLERLYKALGQLKESTMRKLREADGDLDVGGAAPEGASDAGEITIKVKGLNIDPGKLDDATVELETGGDEGEGEPEGDLDLDVGGDEGREDLDLDLGGDDEEDLDEVVEIDEGMLRREIGRLRRLREFKKDGVPCKTGGKLSGDIIDDFGGGKDDGDPWLDHDVQTEAETKKKPNIDIDPETGRPVKHLGSRDEKEREDLESAYLREEDGCDEAAGEQDESDAAQTKKQDRDVKESRFQSVLRRRMRRLQAEGMRSRGRRRQQLREAWLRAASALRESRNRAQKNSRRLNEGLSNRAASNTRPQRPAERSAAEVGLRKQLTEQNLLNVKLTYTNRLLQNETLSARQKAAIIERLDECRDVAEAKRVYESMTRQASRRAEKLEESRVIGSSSQVTSPNQTQTSSQTLTEGFALDRWAELAGLRK